MSRSNLHASVTARERQCANLEPSDRVEVLVRFAVEVRHVRRLRIDRGLLRLNLLDTRCKQPVYPGTPLSRSVSRSHAHSYPYHRHVVAQRRTASWPRAPIRQSSCAGAAGRFVGSWPHATDSTRSPPAPYRSMPSCSCSDAHSRCVTSRQPPGLGVTVRWRTYLEVTVSLRSSDIANEVNECNDIMPDTERCSGATPTLAIEPWSVMATMYVRSHVCLWMTPMQQYRDEVTVSVGRVRTHPHAKENVLSDSNCLVSEVVCEMMRRHISSLRLFLQYSRYNLSTADGVSRHAGNGTSPCCLARAASHCRTVFNLAS